MSDAGDREEENGKRRMIARRTLDYEWQYES